MADQEKSVGDHASMKVLQAHPTPRLTPDNSEAVVDEEKSASDTTPSTVTTDAATVGSAPTVRKIVGWRWTAILIAMDIFVVLYAVDHTIMANIRPPILEHFGHVEILTWITIGYALGSACTCAIWTRMYIKFDQKLSFCSAIFFFIVGSAICGSAPNINALIVGRVITGIGGSGIWQGTNQITHAIALPQERPMLSSIIGVAWCLGTIVGPILGGGLAKSSATWRWAFYVTVCVAGAAAPIIVLIMPLNPGGRKFPPLKTRLQEFDYIGATLTIGTILMLITALSFGGSMYTWGNSRVIGLLVGFGVALPVLIVQQAFCIGTDKDNRIWPVDLAADREMAVFMLMSILGIWTLIYPINFLPLYFQFVRADDALEAGVRKLPHVCFVVFGLLLSGALYKKHTFVAPWAIVGNAILLIGSGLMTTINPSTSFAKIYGYSILMGFGNGLYAMAIFPMAQEAFPHRLTDVTALCSIAQALGIAIGLSVGTCIEVNLSVHYIMKLLPSMPLHDAVELITGATSALLARFSGVGRGGIIASVSKSIQDVFVLAVVAAGICFVLAFGVRMKKHA